MLFRDVNGCFGAQLCVQSLTGKVKGLFQNYSAICIHRIEYSTTLQKVLRKCIYIIGEQHHLHPIQSSTIQSFILQQVQNVHVAVHIIGEQDHVHTVYKEFNQIHSNTIQSIHIAEFCKVLKVAA